MRMAFCIAALAAACLWGPANAADSAQSLVQARYPAQDLDPLLTAHVQALAKAEGFLQGSASRDIAKALKARLPEFYAAAGRAVSGLVEPGALSTALAFSKSQAGQKVLHAERRWKDEVKDQAELCLEESANRIGSAKADRSAAIKAAAALVLGDCPGMAAATEEQLASLAPGRIDQVRSFVAAGGVRTEYVRAALAAASAPAAKALVFHGVYPVTELPAAREAVVSAALSQKDLWGRAAAVHFASALRAPDFDAVAAFAKSAEGKAFLAAKPRIDAEVRRVLKDWVAETAPQILASAQGQGGPEMAAATEAAEGLGMSEAGTAPATPAPMQKASMRAQPKLLLKPVAVQTD